MSERASLLEVQQLLPGTNCGECGESSCMAFATKLIERETSVDDCPPLIEDPKYEEQKEKLVELLKPPVIEVEIGAGENAVTIGGKEVLYRHELRFHNPTALAVDVSDEMEGRDLRRRCREIGDYSMSKMGEVYELDLVAVRNASGDADEFADAVSTATKETDLPFILCSRDPEALEKGVEVAGDGALLYAATEENWREVAGIAAENDCPAVASTHHDAEGLKRLSLGIREMGVEDVVLDPGTNVQERGLAETLSHFTMLRKAAINGDDEDLGFPLLGIPAAAHLEERRYEARTFKESYVASMMIARFADALILHSLDSWSLLGVLNTKISVYQDPQQPAAVDPGYEAIGDPGPDDAVGVTSNFAMTESTVVNDVKGKIPLHLLVADTEGYSVDVGLAADRFTEREIREVMEEVGVEDRVDHRKLIIPGKAARLRGSIETSTGWDVTVGPEDSGDLPRFVREVWSTEDDE